MRVFSLLLCAAIAASVEVQVCQNGLDKCVGMSLDAAEISQKGGLVSFLKERIIAEKHEHPEGVPIERVFTSAGVSIDNIDNLKDVTQRTAHAVHASQS